MELDKFTTKEINTIITGFSNSCKEEGYKTHINSDVKSLGYGGYCNINDNYFIDLHIYPYPKSIFLDLKQKYESFIMDGKTIKTYELRDIKETNIQDILKFVSESTNKLLEEVK